MEIKLLSTRTTTHHRGISQWSRDHAFAFDPVPTQSLSHRSISVIPTIDAHNYVACPSLASLSAKNENDGDDNGGYNFMFIERTESKTASKSDLPAPTVELTDTEIELIARNLKETIDFPFLPNVLEKHIVKAAITYFCNVAPVALPEGLFLQLVSGKEDWESVQGEVLRILNDAICIPIVSRELQNKIVDSICSVIFTSKSKKSANRQMLGRALQTSLHQNSVEDLAILLDGMIDVPFLSEAQEQKYALKIARRMNAVFEAFVPEPMRSILKNTSPEELREARSNLIDRMNERIDIPFKSDEEERVYFAALVDVLLKRYGLAEGTKMPVEELVDVAKELDIIALELEVQGAIYEQAMEELTRKRKALREKKAGLEKLALSTISIQI